MQTLWQAEQAQMTVMTFEPFYISFFQPYHYRELAPAFSPPTIFVKIVTIIFTNLPFLHLLSFYKMILCLVWMKLLHSFEPTSTHTHSKSVHCNVLLKEAHCIAHCTKWHTLIRVNVKQPKNFFSQTAASCSMLMILHIHSLTPHSDCSQPFSPLQASDLARDSNLTLILSYY